MIDKLKPCPKCGNQEIKKLPCYSAISRITIGHDGYCSKCDYVEDVITWDIRAGEAELLEALKETHEILRLEFTGVKFEKIKRVLKKYGG